MSTSPMDSAAAECELARASFAPGLLGVAERGLIPDPLLRWGIRQQCARRLAEERRGGAEVQAARFQLRLAQ